MTLAMNAAHFNFAEELDALLASGFPPNVTGKWIGGTSTPLHAAAARGSVNACKVLLARGADVNIATGRFEWTPLASTAKVGQVETLRFLIERGAIKSLMTKGNFSAIRHASGPCKAMLTYGTPGYVPATKATQKAMEFLSLNEKNSIMWDAIRYKCADELEMVLAVGADPHFVDTKGRLPLVEAVVNGCPICVKVLLKAGADHAKEDSRQIDPLLLALHKKNAAVAEVLSKYLS
eukprot:TRINITY_DN38113_c0_g1_i1.p1 TRINITY_DN38113_c0_g1~~TRINITY_DN38113_c0_g1_i1.p1  ORF type:complete len:235 (+),score=63.09 TRINITY_DN38113_c0_g1_i1:328-1032(+)